MSGKSVGKPLISCLKSPSKKKGCQGSEGQEVLKDVDEVTTQVDHQADPHPTQEEDLHNLRIGKDP